MSSSHVVIEEEAFHRKITYLTPVTSTWPWRGQRSCEICVLGQRSLWWKLIKIGRSTCELYCKWRCEPARTFGAHGQRTLRGSYPYFITLFLWPLPHIHPYLDFTHVWFWIWHFLISTHLMVYFGNLSPFDARLWWLDGGGGNRGPLMTQWWIRTSW